MTSPVVAPGAAAPQITGLEQWQPLVWWCVNRYRHLIPPACRGACTDDDLAGAALDGLLAAQRRFDPTRGVRFMTFAVPTMRWHILMAGGLTRTSGWKLPPASLDVLLEDHTDDPHRLVGRGEAVLGADPADTAWIAELLAVLTPRQAAVLWLRAMEDQPYDAIAAQLGICRSRVSQLYRTARHRARAYLEGTGQPARWAREDAPDRPPRGEAEGPRHCRTCARLLVRGRPTRGECPRCAQYRRRHGYPRPANPMGPVPCRVCGQLIHRGRTKGPGAGHPRRRLCNRHYGQARRGTLPAAQREVA